MVKKGEKISEEALLKLANARKKALEVRQANKAIKDKEKELAKLEKAEKVADLDKKLNSKKKAPAPTVIEPTEEEGVEIVVKAKNKKIDPESGVAKKKKVKYVYESDSSSEEEIIVKKKKVKKPKNKAPKEESDNEEDSNVRETTSTSEKQQPQMTQSQLQREEYLRRVSQMPQYRTNLFGGH